MNCLVLKASLELRRKKRVGLHTYLFDSVKYSLIVRKGVGKTDRNEQRRTYLLFTHKVLSESQSCSHSISPYSQQVSHYLPLVLTSIQTLVGLFLIVLPDIMNSIELDQALSAFKPVK